MVTLPPAPGPVQRPKGPWALVGALGRYQCHSREMASLVKPGLALLGTVRERWVRWLPTAQARRNPGLTGNDLLHPGLWPLRSSPLPAAQILCGLTDLWMSDRCSRSRMRALGTLDSGRQMDRG